jgi:hypothetical protein
VRLLYGPFEPDKPPFLSPGLLTASNVYPGDLGYRPVGQFEALTSALPSKPLGAASFVSPAGVTTIIAGTSSGLYRLALTGWSELLTGLAMVDDQRWRFAQFGGLAIATNGTDAPKKIDLATFTASNLGGSPPTMAMMTVVKDFLVGGVIGGVVNMVQWSAINNAEGWTVGLEQCDYQILPAGGEVTGLVGGEFGLILQRGRVSRMTYVGDNLVFQFDEISNNIGCVSPHSVIQFGANAAWLSDSGFIMWDGATLKPIGQERIDRTFFASYTKADWAKMSTAVDLQNSLIVWAMADRMFVYNWVLDRWSIIDQAAAIVFAGYSRSFSLEDIASIYPQLEMVPYSLDDPRWKGGDPKFFVFDPAFRLGNFSGTPMEATLGTGDIELTKGRSARLSFVRALGDADNISMGIASRPALSAPLTYNSYSLQTASGDLPVRESGRTMRFRQTIAQGEAWTFAQGIDLTPFGGAKR